MYVNTPLIGAGGKPLNAEQKRVQFSQIERAMRNNSFKTSGGCPNKVLIPMTGKLNEAGIKHIFKQDFKYAYNTTKKVVPNLDKMPLPVQLAALHTTFAFGNANRLKKVDVNSPAAVMERVDELRNRKGTSIGELNTIKYANDSIKVAQDNFRMEMERREVLDAAVVKIEEIVPINVASIAKAPVFPAQMILLEKKNERV